jgi:hypothetical protein
MKGSTPMRHKSSSAKSTLRPITTGDLAEIAFRLRGALRGWIVPVPCVEKQAYDSIIDNGRDLLRIQVKSSEVPCSKTRYRINLGHGVNSKTAYTKADIDYFAIYLIPEDTWYLLKPPPDAWVLSFPSAATPRVRHTSSTSKHGNRWNGTKGAP